MARRHGVDIRDLRARQVTADDLYRFTHVIALDGENLGSLEASRPEDSSSVVALLLELRSGREGEAVADPYYGDDDGFDRTWADVSEAAEAILGAIIDER